MATPGGRSDESSPPQQASCQIDDQLQPVPSASRRERLRGGYECEIVRSPEKIQTECSICLQVLKEPQLISCCGHNFCRTCIERVKKDGKNCPLCNEAEFTLMHNKGLERSLKESEVCCTHRKSGCKWIGQLGMLEQHLNVNPEAEKQLVGCEFVELECMYECGHCFQRYILGSHQCKECPKRPFSCDYCREYESTFEDVVNNHYPVCKCYPLSCPNACTPYAIERQNLQRHLDNDCPLQVVDCDFHYTGCEVKLPRRDMPAHLAENFTHMSLLGTFNQKLIRKNDEMAKVILEKNEEMKRLTEDLRREVVENDARQIVEQIGQQVNKQERETNDLKEQLGRQAEQKREINDLRRQMGQVDEQKREINDLKEQLERQAEQKREITDLRRQMGQVDEQKQEINDLRRQMGQQIDKKEHETKKLKEQLDQKGQQIDRLRIVVIVVAILALGLGVACLYSKQEMVMPSQDASGTVSFSSIQQEVVALRADLASLKYKVAASQTPSSQKHNKDTTHIKDLVVFFVFITILILFIMCCLSLCMQK